MIGRSILLGLLMLIGGAVGSLHAQAPPSCEDQVRTLRVYGESLANARGRQELEAAQAISNLLRQLDALRAELATLKKAAGTPKE